MATTVTVPASPPSGRQLRGDAGQGCAFSCGGDQVTRIGPGIDATLAAGVDDAQPSGVEPTAFIGPGAEGDAARDNGMTERPLGIVVRRRQQRIGDEGDDRLPVIEDFPGEGPDLLLDLVLVALAGALAAGPAAARL